MLIEILLLAISGTLDKYYVVDNRDTHINHCRCVDLPDYNFYCDRGFGLGWDIVPAYRVHLSREDAIRQVRWDRERSIKYLQDLQDSVDRVYETEEY